MLRLFLFVVVCILCIQQSSADCCPARGGWWLGGSRCGDCTYSTPCCGYKPCNVFCCGCECRTGTCARRRRDVSFRTENSAVLKFNGLDANKNGMMERCEFIEALERMEITDNVTITHHWTIMDHNKDGVITLAEFDHHKP